MFQITYEPPVGDAPRRLTAYAGFNVNGFFYKIWDTDTLEVLKVFPETASVEGGMSWGSFYQNRWATTGGTFTGYPNLYGG